jgi:hypothetical protein
MLKLAADENFNGKIVRGLLRRKPNVDIIRIHTWNIPLFGRMFTIV